jgi:hypothetical protein
MPRRRATTGPGSEWRRTRDTRRFGCAELDLDAEIGEHGLEGAQRQHHVLHLARVAHDAEPPDLPGEVAETRADLEVVVEKQPPAHFLLVDARQHADRIHLRQPIRLFDQVVKAERLEPGPQGGVVALMARPGILQPSSRSISSASCSA